MTYHFKLMAVCSTLSLAACGGNGPSPVPDESGTPDNGASGNSAQETSTTPQRDPESLAALLERVSASRDSEYTPRINAETGQSIRLDGELAEGEWSGPAADGVEFGRSGFAPVAGFRCAVTGDAVVVSAPVRVQDNAAEPVSDTPDPALSGSLITVSGVATGTFEPRENRPDIQELRIPLGEPALRGLEDGNRIGVSVGTEDIRLMPMSDALMSEIDSCITLAG